MSTQTIRIEHPLARGAEVTPADTWEFPEGLIGLPKYRRFALVPIPGCAPFRLLASLDHPAFGLVVVAPGAFAPDYEVAFDARDLSPLGERDPDHVEVLVPVVLPGDTVPLALNLKGPLLLSATTRRGIQRVSANDDHPVRWVPDTAAAGGAGCSS